ncbi:GntR family transcriptional regulator [Jeotgalibacillus proteolyticus]|uniref:GntR family transcriptional regulator n=1 Tax=Jeotgalibacillus proteolyticus TaxID=2082395 RepID=UPI003CEB762E
MIGQTKRKISIRDSVYEKVKQEILTLKLEPMTKISEMEISKKFDVSRTPVREAFLKLSEDGLIEIIPQSGTLVSRIDMNLVEEGRFVREKLEKAIVSEACRSFDDDHLLKLETNLAMQEFSIQKDFTRMFELDEEFHRLLFQGCNKGRTWELIQHMNTQFIRLRMLRLHTEGLDWNVIVNQHIEIFKMITEKKAEDAEELMEAHLRLVDFEKGTIAEKYPHYFYNYVHSFQQS